MWGGRPQWTAGLELLTATTGCAVAARSLDFVTTNRLNTAKSRRPVPGTVLAMLLGALTKGSTMKSFLKRLVTKEQQPDVMADYATDEWAPVPAGAAAQSANMVGWLTEPSVHLPPKRVAESTGRPRRNTIRRMYNKIRDYMDHLSPEERAIVEAQQVRTEAPRQASVATTAVADLIPAKRAPTPNPAPTPAPAPVAQAAPAPDDATWIKVVETYGSHLTDEELRIIYSQLKEG